MRNPQKNLQCKSVNICLELGLVGETAAASERSSSSSRVQLAGEAGEVGAVLSQRAARNGLSSILNELSVQSGVSLSRSGFSMPEESPRGVCSPPKVVVVLPELPGVDSSGFGSDSLMEDARDLKEKGLGEVASGRCFFRGRLNSGHNYILM